MPQDYRPFVEVPPYKISEDYRSAESDGAVCAKCFIIDRTMVYSAVASAIWDRTDIRQLEQNTFDTSSRRLSLGHQPLSKTLEAIFDQDGRTAWFDVPPMIIEGKAIELGIVDIVTYPFLFAMINQIEEPHRLYRQINHNILAPFVNGLSGWVGVWSSYHFNERPIDDAPAHNLLAFARDFPTASRTSEADLLFRRLPVEALIAVTRQDRYMDSRCSLLQRQPGDAPARPLGITTFEALIRAIR